MTTPRDPRAVARAVRVALTPDLLKPEWQRYVRERPGCDPMTGHCYVATEAAYYLLGGKRAGWQQKFIRHEGAPHWFLVGPGGKVLDITASQFITPVPYGRAIGKGFQTKPGNPSARARVVMARVRARSRT